MAHTAGQLCIAVGMTLLACTPWASAPPEDAAARPAVVDAPEEPADAQEDAQEGQQTPALACEEQLPADLVALAGVRPGLTFKTAKHELTAEGLAELSNIATHLADNPDVQIELAGHSDMRGSTQWNLQLTQGRAERLQTDLVELGVSPGQVTATGYGESQPLTRCSPPDCLVRRVELTIVEPCVLQ